MYTWRIRTRQGLVETRIQPGDQLLLDERGNYARFRRPVPTGLRIFGVRVDRSPTDLLLMNGREYHLPFITLPRSIQEALANGDDPLQIVRDRFPGLLQMGGFHWRQVNKQVPIGPVTLVVEPMPHRLLFEAFK